MELTSRTVRTSGGIRRVVIAAPERGEPTTLQHAALAARIRRDREPIHAVVLRGRDRSIPRTLDDAELGEIGYVSAREQLDAWRPLLQTGVLAVARVELRVWDLTALRVGTVRLIAELDALAMGDGPSAMAAAADRWLLRHALLAFGAGLETVLGEHLPSRLDELERASSVRIPRSAPLSRLGL